MSVAAIGILALLGLLLLIFLRVPIAVALALSGLLGYAALDENAIREGVSRLAQALLELRAL